LNRAFLIMWLLIIFVSAHDGYLVLVYRTWMVDFELNPFGRWLIHRNGGDIWLLLAAKLTGTLAASSLLLWLYWLRPRLGWTACAAIAAFQLGLLLFLHYA
jgi:hypothetical protein